MNQSKDKSGEGASKEERLAARLRENLKRRKAQARESTAADGDALPKTPDSG